MRKYLICFIVILAIAGCIGISAFAVGSTVDSDIDLDDFEPGHFRNYTIIWEVTRGSVIAVTSDYQMSVRFNSDLNKYDLVYANGKDITYEKDGHYYGEVQAYNYATASGGNPNGVDGWFYSGTLSDQHNAILEFLNSDTEYPYYADYDVHEFGNVGNDFFHATRQLFGFSLTQSMGNALQLMRTTFLRAVLLIIATVVSCLALRKAWKICRQQLSTA
jgi:hypothetical protein